MLNIESSDLETSERSQDICNYSETQIVYRVAEDTNKVMWCKIRLPSVCLCGVFQLNVGLGKEKKTPIPNISQIHTVLVLQADNTNI